MNHTSCIGLPLFLEKTGPQSLTLTKILPILCLFLSFFGRIYIITSILHFFSGSSSFGIKKHYGILMFLRNLVHQNILLCATETSLFCAYKYSLRSLLRFSMFTWDLTNVRPEAELMKPISYHWQGCLEP